MRTTVYCVPSALLTLPLAPVHGHLHAASTLSDENCITHACKVVLHVVRGALLRVERLGLEHYGVHLQRRRAVEVADMIEV